MGRWRGRTGADWLLLAEAGCFLLLARAALRIVPVARIVRWIERPLGLQKRSVDEGVVMKAQWAVMAFSRNVPVRLVCFPQALALYAMLRRRGIVSEVLYGAARMDGGLVAHAWLRVGGEVVLGGETAGDFTVLDTWRPGGNAQEGSSSVSRMQSMTAGKEAKSKLRSQR